MTITCPNPEMCPVRALSLFHQDDWGKASYMSLVTLIANCHPSICVLGHGFERSNPAMGLLPVAFGWARFASQESRSNCTAFPTTILPPIGQPESPSTPDHSNATSHQHGISFIVVIFPVRKIIGLCETPFHIAKPSDRILFFFFNKYLLCMRMVTYRLFQTSRPA